MWHGLNCIFLLTLLPLALARQKHLSPDVTPGCRVAIIGAGAAGSSAAYHLSRLTHCTITVYDHGDIGTGNGRTRVIYVRDDSSRPVEVGASMFVGVNELLVNATRDFNLPVVEVGERAFDVWNGEQFVYRQRGNWLDVPRLFLRYGFAPLRLSRYAEKVVETFLRLYRMPPWPSLQQALESLTLPGSNVTLAYLVNTRTRVLAQQLRADGSFVDELLQASSRVNYGQNVDEFHAVEAMVCLSTAGARSVQGGNWQIFSEYLVRSGATLQMESSVSRVVRTLKGWQVEIAGTNIQADEYDYVVLAAPHSLSGIDLPAEFARQPVVDYVKLHVTIVATAANLSSSYFGTRPSDMVLTVPGASTTSPSPFFNSVSRVRSDMQENVFKIFSPSRITDEQIGLLFGSPNDTWVFRKEWHAYPYEVPRSRLPDVEVLPGLFYASSIEPFISTMETSALSGRNIASLISSAVTNGA